MIAERRVAVVPRRFIEDSANWLAGRDGYNLLSRMAPHVTWMARDEAEASVTFVQPIPCAIIRREAGFCAFEINDSVRPDLHGKISMIVGGHIDYDPDYDDFYQLLNHTLAREIAEELHIDGEIFGCEPLGVVIGSGDQAVTRHFGVVSIIITIGNVEPRSNEFSETSMYNGLPLNVAQLTEIEDKLDSWSRIILKNELVINGISRVGAHSLWDN